MKLYRIRWRDGLWQVLCGEQSIAASEDRDRSIQIARKVVPPHDGELYVCRCRVVRSAFFVGALDAGTQ